MDPDHSRSRTTGAVDQKTKTTAFAVFPNRSPPLLSPAEKHRFNGVAFRKTAEEGAALCAQNAAFAAFRQARRRVFCFPICCVLRIQELLLFRKN